MRCQKLPVSTSKSTSAALLRIGAWWGLTLLCLPLDGWVHLHVEGHGTIDLVRNSLRLVAFFGNYGVHLMVLGIALGMSAPRRELKFYAGSLVSTVLLCQILKGLVGRARPGLDLGAFAFFPGFQHGMSENSFPSGDSAAAMALACVLGKWFPRSATYFKVIAVLVATARVIEARHFVSDAVFGLGLGYFVTWLWRRRRASGASDPS